MTTSDQTMWVIRAGKTGDGDPLFMKKKFVAIGCRRRWKRQNKGKGGLEGCRS